MKTITLYDTKIQWHPAFGAAAELEPSANRTELDFQREYNLGSKPLQIDLLFTRDSGRRWTGYRRTSLRFRCFERVIRRNCFGVWSITG